MKIKLSKKRNVIYGCLFGFMLLVLYDVYLNPKIQRWQLNKTEVSGNQVVNAINDCYKIESEYPLCLDDLVPKYIDKIPGPAFGGKEWKYRLLVRDEDAFFSLSAGDYPTLFYNSRDEQWYFDN